MVALAGHVDSSDTTDEATSQPLLKIQSSSYRVQRDVLQYPKPLQILIVVLNHSVLSTIISSSFSVPMTRLPLAGSTIVFN